MPRKKSKDDLLTFDEDSPLFVKKKNKTKRKSKKKSTKKESNNLNSTLIIEDSSSNIENVEVEKPKPRRRRKKKTSSLDLPKYKIDSPKDCKHIHKNFKKILDEKWELLDTGTLKEAGDVPNYLRGVATVIKESRPSEYKEILALIIKARKIFERRNKSGY